MLLEQSQSGYVIKVGAGGEDKVLKADAGEDTYINYNGNRLITAGGGKGGAWNGDKGEGGAIYVNNSAIQTPAIKMSQKGNSSPEWGTSGASLYLEDDVYCGQGGIRNQYGVTGFGLITYIYINEQTI